MRGTKSERIYREVKVNMIGGGAEEIMKDLASRQLKFFRLLDHAEIGLKPTFIFRKIII